MELVLSCHLYVGSRGGAQVVRRAPLSEKPSHRPSLGIASSTFDSEERETKQTCSQELTEKDAL